MPNRQDKTLILTSWSRHYACAASMALIRYLGAELSMSSRTYLPKFMAKLVAEENGRQYDRIIILGISLEYDPENLAESLKHLESPVLWISVYPMSERTSGLLERLLITHVKRDTPLCRLVQEVLEIVPAETSSDGAMVQRVLRIADDDFDTEVDFFWRRVLAAAGERFRKRREIEPYAAAIKDILHGEVEERHRELVRQHDASGDFELIGVSPWLRRTRLEAVRIGESGQDPVLITGESGTGKGILARQIHDCSDRLGAAFTVVSCSNSDDWFDDMIAGEPYPGGKPGRRYAEAAGGTLVLDGVDDLSIHAQAALASRLELHSRGSHGSAQDEKSPPRIIALSRRELTALVDSGEFRNDLYWRLARFELHCPPLRDRMEDVVPLANYCLYLAGEPLLDEEEAAVVNSYSWFGNVWQIQNVVDRIHAFGERDFPALLGAEAAKHISTSQQQEGLGYVLLPVDSLELEDVTRAHMKRVFRMCDENYSKTVKVLDIGSVNTLKKRLKK